MKISISAAGLLLAACGARSVVAPPPAVEVRYQTVTKEVQRPCKVTVPLRPGPLGPLPTDIYQLAALVSAKLAEYAAPGAYAERVDKALRTCTKP